MGRPAKAEARDTRAVILEQSLELFAAQGYPGTSIREIARAAGVRESALYYYFDSKEAILRALIDEHGPAKAAFLGDELQQFVGKAPAGELIRAIAQRIIHEWTSPHETRFMRFVLREGAHINELTDHYPLAQIQKARGHLARVFARLVERRVIRRVKPEAAAMAFIGPLVMLRTLHFILPAASKADPKKFKADVESFLDFFI